MAHKAQIEYIHSIRKEYTNHFVGKRVLDVGSMDINGNTRRFFRDCEYKGLDIGEGPNVDIVCPIHEFKSRSKFDTVICTEMLEHDKHWEESLSRMYNLLAKGGALILTAAGSKRAEHGTTRTSPESSPFTNDYYRNVTEEMLWKALDLRDGFKYFEIKSGWNGKDIYFFGIK